MSLTPDMMPPWELRRVIGEQSETIVTLRAENERLRAALERIVENEDQFGMAWAAEISRAALTQEKQHG